MNMKNIKRVFIFLLAAICLFLNLSVQAQISDKKVPVIELKGNGYERGVQHGSLLKNEIAEVFKKWKNDLSRGGKINADSVIAEFLKAVNFEPAIKKLTPEILDEVKGIADGSKQKYSDVYAFQLVDEFWVYLDKMANINNHHCSCIGIPATKNKPAAIAQNVDVPGFYNGYQVLLHTEKTQTEPEQYILSCAGLIGLTGMNQYGIGVCVNALMDLKASEDGLPVAFIIRGILNKHNNSDALSFVKSIKHASGQNYVIGVQDSVYNFEASANQVVRYLPKGEKSSLVYHTNHAIVNNDIKEWHVNFHKLVLGADGAKRTDSGIRFATLENRLNKPAEELSVEAIKSTLRSKDHAIIPVSRPHMGERMVFTFSSVIYSSGACPSVLVSCGPPDKFAYYEHFFSNK